MKKYSILFVVACMVLCLIPSVGMLFFPTTQTSENRPMAEPPKLRTEEGGINAEVFTDFEAYFNEHLALRNQMVYTDALIQTGLFRESNVSGVISGTDGWLYYSSTLNDYLGTDILSQRELFNLAANFGIVQSYLEEKDIDFALTIAPNKNTLYPEHMPYYKSLVVDPDHSAQLLAPYLADVRYLDLFSLFEAQEEVLYLKQDSHWNQKGACLAYNGIMDTLQRPHEDYSQTEPRQIENTNGDLSRMLYSFYGRGETDYTYDYRPYTYATDTKSVEDGWIVTESEEGTGTLLMFRDSFANTLIPFLSGEFATACYSKAEPNGMERYIEAYDPDCVVIQKVERNISDYLNNPPILTPPAAELPNKITIAETGTTAQAEACLYDPNYIAITGSVDPARMQEDSSIYVSVDGNLYRAYQTGENGYLLYLKKADFPHPEISVKVYIVNDDTCIQGFSAPVAMPAD